MINLQIIFIALVLMFAVVGLLRGWQKEIIAMSGLIMSLAGLGQFGWLILNSSAALLTSDPTLISLPRRQFWMQTIVHVLVAFFSYQVVGRIAEQGGGGRILGDRLKIRSNSETRILGGLVGAINGYLFFGGIWGFLEYNLRAGGAGYDRLALGAQYPFDLSVIARPTVDSVVRFMGWLPMSISPTIWLVLFFVAFAFIIVALI